MDTEIKGTVISCARMFGLDAKLVLGLVQTESGGNRFAWNPEQRYKYLWDVKRNTPFRKISPEEIMSEFAPADFRCIAGDPDQEWWAQQASWGLMQVMGAVARERGYREPYLTALTNVSDNLTIGCEIIQSNLIWSEGRVEQALGAYNAGRGGWSSPAGILYASKVLRNAQEF